MHKIIDTYIMDEAITLQRHANDNPAPCYNFTKDELDVMRRFVRGEHVTFETSNLCQKSWHTLMHRLGREHISLAG